MTDRQLEERRAALEKYIQLLSELPHVFVRNSTGNGWSVICVADNPVTLSHLIPHFET
jgi:hypothetical protein